MSCSFLMSAPLGPIHKTLQQWIGVANNGYWQIWNQLSIGSVLNLLVVKRAGDRDLRYTTFKAGNSVE